MSRATEIGRRIGSFLGEVGTEFRKTSWPERRELVESTLVVITFIVLLAVVVLVCDKAIQFVLTLIRA
jgi:preprotein translocase subunit SecE